MEIRRIIPDDSYALKGLSSISYEYSVERKTPIEEAIAGCDIKRTGWAAVVNGKIISSMSTHKYNVMFDGHTVPMSGIGGVATLPEYRRTGAVRRMFEKALPDLYENGYVFSYLYPFSTDFYRKFGYEDSAFYTCYRMWRESIVIRDIKGYVRLAETDSHKKDIMEVYRAFTSDKNMAATRDDSMWKRIFKPDPVKDSTYTYIWYDDKNIPKAYFTYKAAKWEEKLKVMKLTECLFTDYCGLMGILGFIQSFNDSYTHVEITLPADLNIRRFLPDHPDNGFKKLDMTCTNAGMARVVDVRQAFEKARYFESGAVNIHIYDPFIDQNNGTWHVEFGPDGAKASQTCGEADIETDIGTFTALITGALDLNDLHLNPQIKINNSLEQLKKMFYRKHIWIGDSF